MPVSKPSDIRFHDAPPRVELRREMSRQTGLLAYPKIIRAQAQKVSWRLLTSANASAILTPGLLAAWLPDKGGIKAGGSSWIIGSSAPPLETRPTLPDKKCAITARVLRGSGRR